MEQASFNFMAAVTICYDFGAQENKVSHCFHCFPIYLPWSDESGCHDLIFWMLNFKPTFSLSSFTFIKRLFSSSSLSAISVVSSAYLRLLIFLLAILIPACDSYSLAFYMIYAAYKLNKQGDSMQPWCTLFPIWNQSVVPCPFLTIDSWPAYRFLRRQVRCSGMPISWRIFHVCCDHTVEGFGIVKADLDKLKQIHQLCTDFSSGDSGRPVTPPLTPEKWKTEKRLCCFKCITLRWGHFLPCDKAYLGWRLLSLPRAVGHLQISMVSAAVNNYSKFCSSCVFLFPTKQFFIDSSYKRQNI